MNKVEAWASREAFERGVTTPHSVAGFKRGVQAAYEAAMEAKARKKLSFTPGGDPDDIWSEMFRG